MMRPPAPHDPPNARADDLWDALQAQVAIVDEYGAVVSVNAPWRRFEARTAGKPIEPGQNVVLAGLDQLVGTSEPCAAMNASVAAAVLSVLDGCRPQSTVQYDVYSVNGRRRCVLSVARMANSGRPSAVLAREMLPSDAAATPRTAAAKPSIWVANPDHTIVYWSPEWQHATGQLPADAIGNGWQCAINPFHRKRVAKAWQSASEERRPWVVDASVWSQAHQRFRWHTIAGHPVLAPSGALLRWVGTVEDRHDPIATPEFDPSDPADRIRPSPPLASRIATMSEAMDLLADTLGADVALGALIARTLAPFWSDGGEPDRWIVEGPSVGIRGAAALPLALTLQELASQSASRGALATNDGTLTIRWHADGMRSPVYLTWQEQGPGLSAGPAMTELATRLQLVQGPRGCILVQPDFDAEGICYRVEIPPGIDFEPPGAA